MPTPPLAWCRFRSLRAALVVGLLGPALLGTVLVAGGCRGPDDRFYGPYPREVQFSNAIDPEKEPRLAEGQHYFLHETWGTETLNPWPPTWFLLEVLRTEWDVFGDQFTRFGTLFDPTDDLPVGLKRGADNPDQVHETCAFCHVADLPDGRRWMGAPNTRLDIMGLKVALNDRWVAAGYEPLLSELDKEKMLACGPGRIDASSSDYPRPVPADYPPYFRLGEKTALNYLGTGGDVRSESAMSIYAFGAGEPADEHLPVPFPSTDKHRIFAAFLGQLEAPENFFQQNTSLVPRGAEVFREARCNLCHFPDDVARNGVVTFRENEPELLPGDDEDFERGTIATSAAHRILIDGDPDAVDGEEGGGVDVGRLGLIAFIVTNGFAVGTTDGYRVPDLGGLWATAPYLHNGSVPTLEDLLKPPPERPVLFMRDGFEVDTTAFGNSNEGHAFGTDLSDADKQALIAYLQSL